MSGIESGRARAPAMNDSATTSGGDLGAGNRTGRRREGRRGARPHPPSSPQWLLSSPRPWREAIWANLTGYYGNSAPQPLVRRLRKAYPIRSCRGSREPTPTPHVWAGVRRCGEEAERGLQRDLVPATSLMQWLGSAEHFRSSSASAAHQCRIPSLPEGESPARRGPSPGVQDFAEGEPQAAGLLTPFLSSQWAGDEVVQSGFSERLTWGTRGLESLPQDLQEASSHSQSNILRSFQRPSSGRAVWVTPLPRFTEDLTWQPPEYPKEPNLALGRGQVCVCVNMRAHWCQHLERIWLHMSLFCAYLTHVYE